jgi:hypothetical protein
MDVEPSEALEPPLGGQYACVLVRAVEGEGRSKLGLRSLRGAAPRRSERGANSGLRRGRRIELSPRKPARRPERSPMFDVSRTVLIVIAVIALVLLVLGLATDVGIFGWVLAIILGAYVIAALVRGQRAA